MAMSGLNAKGVPPQPAFLRIIKVVIIFLSVVILALAAYAISIFGGYYGYYGSAGVAGLLIFVVSFTPTSDWRLTWQRRTPLTLHCSGRQDMDHLRHRAVPRDEGTAVLLAHHPGHRLHHLVHFLALRLGLGRL
jgi:hypothetical protein